MSNENSVNNSEKKIWVFILQLVVKLTAFALIVLIIFATGKKAYDFGFRLFSNDTVEQAPGTDVILTVESGMSVDEVTDMLYENKLIEDKLVFKIHAKLSSFARSIKAGTYTLNTSYTMKDMMIVMSGKELNTEEE